MSAAPARLFVALELGARSRAALAQWAASLGGPGVRPVDADALHVTLCFLGDTAVGEVPAIVEALARVGFDDALARIRSDGALTVAVERARWLPSRRPRVLALELADPDAALRALQSAVARALELGGWYHHERRGYLPHVTVARVRDPGRRPAPESPALMVRPEAVVLLRSHLGHGPARYERLASWPIR